ncbi:hypothetical protein NM688_g7474 [Phlebia brevispora]|uniref:Uncharacterized protein n=1 Tax=Phlebia brevispora TaxID=194682 RepID=A0ACC1S4X0_9APHY|nr:hypothetical protein NM688_g7474 [Phlebia brevispora]
MSFQDIESGLARPSSPLGTVPQSPEESAFLTLQSSLSLQVFKLNSNVQGILKLVDQLGTPRDSASLRKSLHDLTETTRAMVKRGSEDLKKLAALQAPLPKYKTSMHKTSHDFQMSLVAFQHAQQVSAERQRTVVESVKHAVEEEEHPEERPSSPTPSQRQTQIFQTQLSPQELAYQESLIQEREEDIREIETGIHELHQIFRDLGTLVQDQGEMLDNIESNIDSIAVDTGAAAEELTTAHEYQRKAGRRALCLMLVLVVVIAVVLIALGHGTAPIHRVFMFGNSTALTNGRTAPHTARTIGALTLCVLSARQALILCNTGGTSCCSCAMISHSLRLGPRDLPDFDDDFAEVRVTIYMGFLSFTILVWEHMITFGDEVEYIWKGHKGLRVYLETLDCPSLTVAHATVAYLFFLNRYLTPFGFIINLFAYLSPSWTPEVSTTIVTLANHSPVCFHRGPYSSHYHLGPANMVTARCQHFVRYEGSMTVIGINTTALMMLLRVYAMYSTRLRVVAGVAALFLVELGVNAWLLAHGTAVIHHRSIHGRETVVALSSSAR